MYKRCGNTLKQLTSFSSFSFGEKSRCEHVAFKSNNILSNFNARYSSVLHSENKRNRVKNSYKRKLMDEVKNKWIVLGKYSVFPWSIAGVETCVVVEGENLKVAFDMGYSVRESVKCQDVFISHGHIDHMSGIVHHASRRNLTSMKRATYHMLPTLVRPIENVAAAVGQAHGGDDKFTELLINPVTESDNVKLPSGFFVRPFPTHHRAPSQGYLIYKQNKKLKSEYQGLPGPEIGKLAKEGVDIHDIEITPEIAYTGDTTFEVFTAPTNPDLLKVKILITEATYIDDDKDKRTGQSSAEKARARGHCHLNEFVTHEHLFKDVQNIVLVHMSDKYSAKYLHRTVQESIPESLAHKIHLGTYMKDNMG